MKTKDKEVKRSLTVAELSQELRQAQENIAHLAWKHSLSPLDNPMELRNSRRYIARLKTWIGQKNMENAHGS